VVSPCAIASATTCTGCRSLGFSLLIILHACRSQAVFQHTTGIRQGQADVGEGKDSGKQKPQISGAVRSLAYLVLDGEGVFEALHALFQVLNLPLLLGQQQVLDPV
jgi:hypothetical protein